MEKKALYRHLPALIITLFFLGLFFIQCNRLSFIQDDTFISMRYAKNLVEGNGLVFNLNEKTEGYTSFLWVIILGAALKTGIDLELFSIIASQIFGAIAIIITMLLASLILKNIYKNGPSANQSYVYRFIPLIILPLYVFNAAYVYWAASGMEETLFMSLVLLCLYFLVRNINTGKFGPGFIIFGVLACLTRPEGIFLVSSMLAMKFIVMRKQAIPTVGKTLVYEAITLGSILFLFIACRYSYYGYLLPNTFYAKSGFTFFHLKRGWEYFYAFLTGNLLFGLLFFIPFVLSLLRKDRILFILISFSLFFCFLITIIGGDVLPLHRLFFPVLPLIYLSLVISASTILHLNHNRYIKQTILLLLIALICFFSYQGEMRTAMEKRSYETGLVFKMKAYASWMKEKQTELGRTPVAALSTIGAFSFYSDADVIDLAGLTDSYTAHNKKETDGINDSLPVLWKEHTYNAGYVLKKNPDYIIFPAGAKPTAFPECALFVQPEFIQNYYIQLIYSEELNEYLPVFSRRRGGNLSLTSVNWDNRFTSNYINATNLFLSLTRTGNPNLIPAIEREINEMLKKCPQRKSEAYSLLGYANYHIKQHDKAQLFLDESLRIDSLASPAMLYLRNIALIKKDTVAAVKYLMRLKQASPDALPNLLN